MAESFLHSVYVQKELCNGCLTCVKFCPTEAIRVQKGKADIVAMRCIDCGECIRQCPTHAMQATADKLLSISEFEYNVALTAPSLYAQFPPTVPREAIWAALKKIGFDEIFDLSAASDYISKEIENYVKDNAGGRKPLISSACPAVLRLIQVQFPELIKQVLPILAPGEAAAIYTRREVVKRTGLPNEKVGIWFITPCPAKGTNIHQSVDVKQTAFNGSIAISSIMGTLLSFLGDEASGSPAENITIGSSYGVGWGSYGGEIRATGIKNSLSVHGVREVYSALEQISMNKMPDLQYLECYACPEGCIGGPFAVENRYVARKNLQKKVALLAKRESASREEAMARSMTLKDFPTSEQYVKTMEPRPMLQLDDDIEAAIAKMEKMEKILAALPGVNCGACGAPTCQSLAEDIVRGDCKETACIFILREQVRRFAKGMIKLSQQIPLDDDD